MSVPSALPVLRPAELLEKLNRCLGRFDAVAVNDITDVYDYYPNLAQSKLGEGSYGAAYRMKHKSNDKEPLRVVKVIAKERITRHLLQIQHLCAELAATKYLQHRNINRRVGLYHDCATVYMVLELVEGKKPDLATRLYHVFARHARKRIADVPRLVRECPAGAEDLVVQNELRALGLPNEAPLATDLFNAIVYYKRLPPKKALVILKQILQGLEYLHQNLVVHRDMKTENLVLGEDRKATPILAQDGETVIGVRIEERLSCRIIDFGLVKHLRMTQFPISPSPSAFGIGIGNNSSSSAASDPFAAAAPLSQIDAHVAPPGAIPVTPCGTELYCSLEVIRGIISSGFGRQKWESTREALPKFDVYGAGTMMFCMCNGRPPFRFSSYRAVTREEKLRQMLNMIAAGPQFSPTCAEYVKPITSLLMTNDVEKRPTATRALQDAVFKNITTVYAYEAYADGRFIEIDVPEECAIPVTEAQEKAPADNEEGDEEAHVDPAQDAEDLRAAMAALRGREDGGDSGDKDDVPEEGPAAPDAAVAPAA